MPGSSRKERIKQKRRALLFSKKYNTWFIGLLLFAAIYNFLIEPTTIGHDKRYTYLMLSAVVIGLVIIFVYRRNLIMKTFIDNQGHGLGILILCIYLLQGALFSYVTAGQLVKMAWDVVNYTTASQNEVLKFKCDVTKFLLSKRADAMRR